MQTLDPRRDFGKNPSRSTTEQTPSSRIRCEDLCDAISDRGISQSCVSSWKWRFNHHFYPCSIISTTATQRAASCFTGESPHEGVFASTLRRLYLLEPSATGQTRLDHSYGGRVARSAGRNLGKQGRVVSC